MLYDMDLTEATFTIADLTVSIYKVGGGTIGKAYDGDWHIRVSPDPRVLFSPQIETMEFTYQTPRNTTLNHLEAAMLAFEHYRCGGSDSCRCGWGCNLDDYDDARDR